MASGTRTGRTDDGLRFDWLRTPDEAPPVVIALKAPFGKHWTEAGSRELLGRGLALKWRGRPVFVRVVGVSYNAMTNRLEVTLK